MLLSVKRATEFQKFCWISLCGCDFSPNVWSVHHWKHKIPHYVHCRACDMNANEGKRIHITLQSVTLHRILKV